MSTEPEWTVGEFIARLQERHRSFARAYAEAPTSTNAHNFDIGSDYWWAIVRDIDRIARGAAPWFYDDLVKRIKRRTEERVATMRRHKELGITPPRDSQRAKVYAAERTIRPLGRSFSSIEEIQGYVDRLVGSAWFRRRWGKRRITVERGRAGSSAMAVSGPSVIQMPEWSWCEPVVLHEVAHLCTDRQHTEGFQRVAAHGREYAAILLILVRRQMGDDAWRMLKLSFVKYKVKHTAKRSRAMTDEQREAAVERLALARAAKEQDR
jgi:putative metallohydrolase (TIGR04338 family)